MSHDYCCCGSDKTIHWFCSEGDKEINADQGHGAYAEAIRSEKQEHTTSQFSIKIFFQQK
jgi:hypothetical protein